MATVSAKPRILIYDARPIAALLVVSGLSLAQWAYLGSDAPDWQGYRSLYEGTADWLGPGVFTTFLAGARWLFGAEGYGAFRLVLFTGFAGFAAALALRMPAQPRLGAASAVMVAGAVLAALGLKTVVQIREGLAFLVFLGGPLGMIVSPTIHVGLAPLSLTWLASCAPWRISIGLMSAVSAGIGIGAALIVVVHADEVTARAAVVGVDVSATAIGGWLKLAYWAVLGAAVWMLRYSLSDGDRFDQALGAGLLIGAYAFCASLVVMEFEAPAVTSLGIRVLITAMDLAVLRVCLRGRADLTTAVVAAGMICDELRLLTAG